VLSFFAVSKPTESSIVVLLPEVLFPEQAIARGNVRPKLPNWSAFPALSRSLARGGLGPYQPVECEALEAWLASTLGWNEEHANDQAAHCPWAMVLPLQATRNPLEPPSLREPYTRFFVSPVHLQVAQDGVYLIAPDQLQLSETDQAALWASVLPILEPAGWVPVSNASRLGCLMQISTPLQIDTPSPWSTAQLDISSFLPQGPALAAWRALWMDLQMHLHDHPVNHARQLQGLPTINALWWWGGGQPWQARYDVVNVSMPSQTARSHRLQTLLAAALPHEAGPESVRPARLRVIMSDTSGPHEWFEPTRALSDFSETVIRPLHVTGTPYLLVLTGQAGWRSVSVNSNVRWKFWRRSPELQALIEPAQTGVDEHVLQQAWQAGQAQQSEIQKWNQSEPN